ncbi:ATP-dependent dethiobiotin synthetase BioD [Candidatus Binatus sp.]|uniref:ATP-dependent dethiobiotin synthetase BioD n=1 Tax=Candidatus Binatus sp. TaxID=2811406 RepID=UPI003C319B43
MGRRFLITGTGPRVGKTTIACALGFAMRARGLRVGVMKPVDTLDSQDAQALALAVGSTMPMDLICPYRRDSTPSAADAPDLAHIAECFNKIVMQNDVVIVESSDLIDFADLAATLDLEVIVIVGNRPGYAAAATLTIQRCETRGLKIAGYILCDCDPTPSLDADSLQQTLKASYLGRMRHREPLSRTIVEKLI